MADILTNPALGVRTKSRRHFVSLSGGGFRAALYHAGVLRALHENRLLDRDSFVNCVSGGVLAASIWEIFLSKEDNLQDKEESFPEDELLKLIAGTPRFGGRFNWLIRRFTFRETWREYLAKWESNLLARLERDGYEQHRFGNNVRPSFFFEMIDLLTGGMYVFSNGHLGVPRHEYFAKGISHNPIPMSRSDAMAACTAFPGYFRAIRHEDYGLQLLDAGFVDNIGMVPFLGLLDGRPERGPLVHEGDVWFFSNAGKRLEEKTLGSLSWIDGAFRLAGDISQPLFQDALQMLVSKNYKVKTIGAMIGLLADGDEPWIATNNIREPMHAAYVETALSPMKREDAVAIMAQGAQATSYALEMDQATRDKLKKRFKSLLG
jgi:patatin-like phospholipase